MKTHYAYFYTDFFGCLAFPLWSNSIKYSIYRSLPSRVPRAQKQPQKIQNRSWDDNMDHFLQQN